MLQIFLTGLEFTLGYVCVFTNAHENYAIYKTFDIKRRDIKNSCIPNS